MSDETFLDIRNLKKYFAQERLFLLGTKKVVRAVDGVTFTVRRGETVSLVGESGCGKTTVARCIVRLVEPTSGEIFFRGKDILKLNKAELRQARAQIQMVFQDRSCLDPRMIVGNLVAEPLKIQGTDKPKRIKRAEELLENVGLSAYYLSKRPHELSGGERQRVIIARALALKPKFLIADEPVSSLDVSVQAKVLNLLLDLKKQFDLTLLFISHDLNIVKHISDKVVVMYAGKIAEIGGKEVFQEAFHPYTLALVSSTPSSWLNERLILKGEAPDLSNIPAGCKFHPRCPYAKEKCKIEEPILRERGSRLVRCHFDMDELRQNP